MQIHILTLFPEMYKGVFNESIVKRASEKGLVDIKIYNLRDWATNNHKTVDGRPYGGGAGMVMRVDIIDRALHDLKLKVKSKKLKVVLTDATGKIYTQRQALKYSKLNNLILIAGHYEGVDHRVHEHLANEVVSVGDYVLSGGEIPTMLIVDSVVRLLPDAIDPKSLREESFGLKGENSKTDDSLEYPQYTRPEEYNGWKVPKVLLNGNHKEISDWRDKESKKITALRSKQK